MEPNMRGNQKAFISIRDKDFLRRYYEKIFQNLQQTNCRVLAKAYVKLVEPRKQVNFPYNGRKIVAGQTQQLDPDDTKPPWWPTGVSHREPDHLPKAGKELAPFLLSSSLFFFARGSRPPAVILLARASLKCLLIRLKERIRLLVHILCELRTSYGITARKLKASDQPIRRQILPAERLDILDEIYQVREEEEKFLDQVTGMILSYLCIPASRTDWSQMGKPWCQSHAQTSLMQQRLSSTVASKSKSRPRSKKTPAPNRRQKKSPSLAGH